METLTAAASNHHNHRQLFNHSATHTSMGKSMFKINQVYGNLVDIKDKLI